MNNQFRDNSPVNSKFNIDNYNNRNNLCRLNPPPKKNNKKLNFKTMRSNTISSLNDVEHFLNNLQHAVRYIKIYKLFK